ncbi:MULTISPECIES: tetratricopeptide repeat protein [unclassified Moraxella]|uniref:tetratricopeptide repeat protein n=1 Tax=unclassified Moraxella TaxID=2685852 RepID=UPI00359DF350
MKQKFWQITYPTQHGGIRLPIPRFSKKITRQKTVAIVICLSLVVCVARPAQAGVFDPLLKVLLPFYKKNKEQQPLPNDDALDEMNVDVGDEQFIDDGDDSHYPLINDGFSEILLSDGLTNDLNVPDLQALLTAEFAADRGDVATALAIYKVESFKQNATAIFERALSLSIEYEQPKESLAFAAAWQSQNPDHIPAWFYVTHLALKAKAYNQAVQMLAAVLQYDPRTDLSQIFISIFPNNPTDQRELFDALQYIQSNNSSVAALRAGLLMRLNEHDAALLHINESLKSEPNNLAFINLKLDILNTAGRLDELWSFLHTKRRTLPQETSLYLYEIRHLINQGDLSNAWRLLLEANKHTQNPDVILLAGLVGLDIGEYRHAIEILIPLVKNPIFSSQAHYYLGIGHERLGDFVQARHHYERVKNDDNVLDARTKVVGFYLLENNVNAAISTLIRLRDEYQMYAADSYILQAEIYLRQGNIDTAKDLLSTANRQYPDDDRLLFASYQLLENELSDEEKRLAMDKLVQLDGFNPNYQLEQAKLILKQNPDDQQALTTVKAIIDIRANDPLYDKELQLQALILLSENALIKGNYHAVIDHLQAPYEVSLDLNAGILLLRAYQGLGDDNMVQKLLAELQNTYGFNQESGTPTSEPAIQSY